MRQAICSSEAFHHSTVYFCYPFFVRNSFWWILFLSATLGSVPLVRAQVSQATAQPATQSTPQQSPSAPAGQPTSHPQQGPPAQTQAPVSSVPVPQAIFSGPVIVLDPAHGGTDPGARGPNGATEKDMVLQFARALRIELVRQGYRTVLTRDDDSNPSYDDRAANANSYHDAIFISLHISSTGAAGTARAYFYQFWAPFSELSNTAASASNGSTASAAATAPHPPTPPGLVPWNEAQRSYADASHRLADQLQMQLAQVFSGSPAASAGVAIRELRSVAAPAVAVEISSVSAGNAQSLSSMAEPLASSIVKGLESFRPPNSAEAK